jgi:ferredoxin, 2Fe-2S
MTTEKNELDFAAGMNSAVEPARTVDDRELRNTFAARLKEVAAHPEVVPIEFDGQKIDQRLGGTLLGAALKNGIRLMHVCGARTLCGTCRVVVESGEDNLTPMRAAEKFSLRWHLSISPRTRLACQARVNGPVDVESVFPLCGDLPNR